MRVFIPLEFIDAYTIRGTLCVEWMTRWLDEGFSIITDFSRIRIVDGEVGYYDHSILFGCSVDAVKFKLLYL